MGEDRKKRTEEHEIEGRGHDEKGEKVRTKNKKDRMNTKPRNERV